MRLAAFTANRRKQVQPLDLKLLLSTVLKRKEALFDSLT